MNLYIIYTEKEVLLTKKKYKSWRDIQDEYEFYKTSLGPWNKEEVTEFLTAEYPKLSPKAHIQINKFEQLTCTTYALTFEN